MDTVNIQIPSLTENLRIVESFIDNVKERFRLDDDIYGNIMISVTESVNNAIHHGNRQDKDKNVSVTLHLNESEVRFTIQDQGKGFDFHNLPDPTAPDNIEKLGGRGIFLMKNLADEVHFEDEGRVVILVFYLS
ncbi:MAG: ATP-binding protein [Cyclobacteriaceae bacterium]|nr:ATP-binding protein [Cyclobacteriaceae bacterium]